MVTTRRASYIEGLKHKKHPIVVQNKLQRRLDTASREIEKAHNRVDELESNDQVVLLKQELDSIKEQRDVLEQNLKKNFTEADRRVIMWRESAKCLKDECAASRQRETQKDQQLETLEAQCKILTDQLKSIESRVHTATYPPAAEPLTPSEINKIREASIRAVLEDTDLEAALEAVFI